MEGRSTVGAIKKIVDIARQSAVVINRKMQLCGLIALDIRNAFNAEPRQKIVNILEGLHVAGDTLRFLTDYLRDRTVRLKDEKRMITKTVYSGVPQGSMLGPTLWNILYNGVLELNVPDGVTTIAYADDLAVAVVAGSEVDLMRKANWLIEEIRSWFGG